MEWVRLSEPRVKRWHAVYCTQFGLRFTYCARTIRVGSELEPTQDAPTKCGCCQSRIKNPFNVPESLRAIKSGMALPPSVPSRKRASRHGEIAITQGKLYA